MERGKGGGRAHIVIRHFGQSRSIPHGFGLLEVPTAIQPAVSAVGRSSYFFNKSISNSIEAAGSSLPITSSSSPKSRSSNSSNSTSVG